jgi:glycerol uptake facilitator-like aquaporin
VTLARSLTNTFSGIRPSDAPGFIIVQIAGALAATALFRFLSPAREIKAPSPVDAAIEGKKAA